MKANAVAGLSAVEEFLTDKEDIVSKRARGSENYIVRSQKNSAIAFKTLKSRPNP